MKEIKLPFDLNPELNTYLNLAHPLGILGGNIPDKSAWFPWLCNKYINCYYVDFPQKKLGLYTVDGFFLNDNIIEQLEFKIIPKKFQSVLTPTPQSLAEHVKLLLTSGAYVHGTYNERYISAASAYGKYDHLHDYLLFGFSDELGCFFAAGYVADGTYQEYKISYEEYYESIFQPVCTPLTLQIMRFDPSMTAYDLNLSVVLRDLRHYLSSTAFRANKDANRIYGLSAWEKLCEHISYAEKIDLRATKIFMEHHKLMHMRLEYLSKQNIISPSLFEKYITAKSDSDKVYLLSMKYDLTQKESIKSSCLDLIRNVVDLDKSLLPSVISQIEEKTGG